MTTLINLESYLECCQYAHLFAEDPEKLIPSLNGLPLAYRDFCRRHQSQSFLPIPAMAIKQPQNLSPRKSQLLPKPIGLPLDDTSSEQIFIVREANSFVLRALQSRYYIYANAYRYWSYAEQLQPFTNKPLVIYDLDNFTPSQITPLTFENRNAPYPIPIIDTRSPKQYDSLKLSQPYEKIYNSICLAIANKILQDLNIDTNNRLEVANYIKKINLLQNTEFTFSEDISSILEIDDRFYSYNLSQENLEDIIFRRLPISELNRVINENPNYNFVLFSSYTKLSGIKTALKKQFQNTLFAPNLNIKSDFLEIWQQKAVRNFPLFGQHLDRISFSVRRSSENRSSENIEICLPDEICYEGEKEAIVYGEYPKDGKLEQNFSLKNKDVTLPFRINDQPFYINNETDIESETGIEQIYKIENQYFNETPTLDIRIRFRLQPGLAPKLEILDNYKRIIDSKLIDLDQSLIQAPETLGFIPIEKIFEARKTKTIPTINIMQNVENSFTSLLLTNLNHLINKFELINISSILNMKEFNQANSNKLYNEIKSITDSLCDFKDQIGDKLSIFYFPDLNINGIIHIVDKYQKLVEYSLNLIPSLYKIRTLYRKLVEENKPIPKYIKRLQFSIMRYIETVILITGKSYLLTTASSKKLFFNDKSDELYGISSNLYWQNLARMSCSSELQDYYFDRFRTVIPQQGKFIPFIWGYARILIWYFDFSRFNDIKLFENHFCMLLNYCLNNLDNTSSYLQDTLITLIYLLTFREIDPHFVEQGSEAYNQSKKLCEKLAHTEIKSKNVELPLNQFFEQLIDGSATQEQVSNSNMIEID
jgi:hypothetical protein